MVKAPHKYCLGCQAELDLDAKTCPYCGIKQLSRLEVVLQNIFRSILPAGTPATKFLLFVNLVMFVILTADVSLHPEFSIFEAVMSPPGELVYRWGAHLRGDFCWWRMVTANFIHIGLVHLLFNMMALRYVGPYVERTFGSCVTYASYVLCGVLSMAASNIMGGEGLVAGASGAIMAFIGMAAVAAHLENTPLSIRLRNSMLLVAVTTVVFGLVINGSIGHGVDNIAHVAGLIVGAIVGYILPKQSTTGFTKVSVIRFSALTNIIAFALCCVSFAYMSSASVSTKYQNECIRDLKLKKYAKALNDCQLAYDNDKSQVISYHNYILALAINNRIDEAVQLCEEGEQRFESKKKRDGKLSFDALCNGLKNE